MAFVGAEIVAAVTAAAVQSQREASMGEIVGTVAGILAIVGVVFGWYVKANEPFKERRERQVWKTLDGEDGEKFDRLWFKTAERNPDKFARLVFRTLDRDDDSRAVLRRLVDRLYIAELAVIAMAEKQISANKDAIEFLEASNQRQGEALTKELARAMQHIASATDAQTRAQQEQSRIMEDMRKELTSLGKAYERIDERMNSWDGHERRQKPR